MHTTTTAPVTDHGINAFPLTDDGEGNWTVDAPNDTWTITATSAEPVDGIDSFHVGAESNHHLPEGWYDTLVEALAHVVAYGVDRRRNAHA